MERLTDTYTPELDKN